MDENEITRAVMGAAIEVHKHLGPGLLESAYEEALCRELSWRKIKFERQKHMPMEYEGVKLDCGYRLDLLSENKVVVGAKAVDAINDVHTAQVLTYLKLVGLIINFNVAQLRQGIRRVVNKYQGPNEQDNDDDNEAIYNA
jgi:GxxExxY protein